MPESLPGRLYEIVDVKNGINESTVVENLRLERLLADHLYELSVRLRVEYLDRIFEGAPVAVALRTEVGVPGVVRNFVVEQEKDTSSFEASWDRPAANETNGPIDFYYLRVLDEFGAVLESE